MTPRRFRAAGSLLAFLYAATPAVAQMALPATQRGVPTGPASADPIALSLADAVARGLERNLAIILEQQHLASTESANREAMSALLPHLSGSVRQVRQVVSTAAFGFDFPGLPSLVGPFDLFDARLGVSTALFDARAIGGLKGSRALTRAGRADVREMREAVALAIGVLYLQTEADEARVASARAQVDTADALVRLADDQRTAGLVAGVDVLRQQVQLQSARARLIDAENVRDKRKITLARAIGLPAGQAFTLTDTPHFVPTPPLTTDEAVNEALANRRDLAAAQARLEAARARRGAERAGTLPSVHVDADVGGIGRSTSAIDRTWSVTASLHVPIFEGGATQARTARATADLRAREAELADLTNGVRYEVEAALLDIKATDASVAVADAARALSQQELEQARDRFRAGVASSLELVQAQESVAASAEQYITSVYAHAAATGALVRALGQVETHFVAWVGGQQ